MKHDKDSEKYLLMEQSLNLVAEAMIHRYDESFNDVTTETINLKPASKSSYDAVEHPLIIGDKYNDRLPSGEPCTTDEVAGLGWLNFGRLDPIRKPAVFHDRLYDGIIAGTSDITQDKADDYYLNAMLAERKHHQLGTFRSYLRSCVVHIVSLFRRVGK